MKNMFDDYQMDRKNEQKEIESDISGKSKKTKKTQTAIYFTMSAEDKARLKLHALKKNITLKDLMNTIVKEWIENNLDK